MTPHPSPMCIFRDQARDGICVCMCGFFHCQLGGMTRSPEEPVDYGGMTDIFIVDETLCV